MKKIIALAFLLFFVQAFRTSQAQVSVDISINIESQPVWGPVGYDHVEYYYLPDIDAFYYVPRQQYVYMQSGRWIFSASLPPAYSRYDLYGGYKVVVNDPRPYRNIVYYRTKYSGYKNNRSQEMIRNSREPKYFVNRGHPEYRNWKKDRDQGKNENKGNRGNSGKNKGRRD